MARKQTPLRSAVPGALQHPPAPLKQERDTSYLFGATVMIISLLSAGLLFHPEPTTLGIGPEPGADAPLVAEAATGSVPNPTQAPVATPFAAASTVASTQSETRPAIKTATQADTGAGSGGGSVPTSGPVTTPTASKPVIGIKPVDTVINRTLDLVKGRSNPKTK